MVGRYSRVSISYKSSKGCLNLNNFQKIEKKIKKFVECKYCSKRIPVDNFNRRVCKECGYRDKENRKQK